MIYRNPENITLSRQKKDLSDKEVQETYAT